jgi:hypothetical protein
MFCHRPHGLDAVHYCHRHDEAGVEEIGSRLARDENIARETHDRKQALSLQRRTMHGGKPGIFYHQKVRFKTYSYLT